MVGETDNLSFGEAIRRLKDGFRLRRAGWNGKGMCIWLNKGSADRHRRHDAIEEGEGLIGGVSLKHFETGDDNTVTRMPNLNMQAADGATVTGWLASQTDILAEDWEVVV